MKLFVPGKASEESAKTPANIAKTGIALPMPAACAQFAAVQALIDDAHDDEQRPGGDAVIDHHQHRPFNARLVQRENAERREPHVGHARIGHQLLQVRLRQRRQPAVKDRHHRKRQDEAA